MHMYSYPSHEIPALQDQSHHLQMHLYRTLESLKASNYTTLLGKQQHTARLSLQRCSLPCCRNFKMTRASLGLRLPVPGRPLTARNAICCSIFPCTLTEVPVSCSRTARGLSRTGKSRMSTNIEKHKIVFSKFIHFM